MTMLITGACRGIGLALARGKEAHDKRETIKAREADREARVAIKTRRRSGE